jgi:hypothetical protein
MRVHALSINSGEPPPGQILVAMARFSELRGATVKRLSPLQDQGPGDSRGGATPSLRWGMLHHW